MKFLSFLIVVLLSFSVYGADCDTVIPKEKEGGCEIGTQSGDLITCLINAKNDAETKKCNEEEKARKCKKISNKFKEVKDAECNMFYNSKKIDCLIKAKVFDECKEEK